MTSLHKLFHASASPCGSLPRSKSTCRQGKRASKRAKEWLRRGTTHTFIDDDPKEQTFEQALCMRSVNLYSQRAGSLRTVDTECQPRMSLQRDGQHRASTPSDAAGHPNGMLAGTALRHERAPRSPQSRPRVRVLIGANVWRVPPGCSRGLRKVDRPRTAQGGRRRGPKVEGGHVDKQGVLHGHNGKARWRLLSKGRRRE